MLSFASALPESVMARMGKIYLGRPIAIKDRKALLAALKPSQRAFLRTDTGDMPEMDAPTPARSA